MLAADIVPLDQWKVTLRLSRHASLPPMFHQADPQWRPREWTGHFQNYFSVGMDAAVTYGVDRSRRTSIAGRCCFWLGLGKACYGVQAHRAGFCPCCKHYVSVRGDAVEVRDQEDTAAGGATASSA